MNIDELRKDAYPEQPKQIESPDLTDLKEICQEYINQVSQGGYVDDDFDHYIFETALITVFGKDVFQYVNRMRNQ